MVDLIAMGAIAGVIPVYLGIGLALAVARVLPRTWEGFFIGVATGVLIFLFFDLMHESIELTGARDLGSWLVFLSSLLISFVGLVALEQRHQSRNRVASVFFSLPYMIALGMGLHNLGEGLSIGASYGKGEWVLGGLLIIGYALHNGTEGFGIISAAGKNPVTSKDALFLGLIAGVPTCLGALISGQFDSPYFTIACYTVAAGSLLYVILSLTNVGYTASRRVQAAFGIFTGISLMYVTAMVLTLVSGIKS